MFLSLLGAVLAVFGCSDITAPTSSIRPRTRAGDASASGVVVVSPADMHGWQFIDDATNTACTNTTRCALVSGPGTPPLGSGSAELATPAAADGKALVLQAYAGTRFDHITSLAYSTYRQSSDAGNNLAIALQFNVDYDLTDAATGYQGRLVFEPYQGNGGNVPQSTWQRWDAKAGRWWGTRTSVPKNGVSVTNSCVQATPCTWTQLLAAFPDLGIHATMGAVVLKAGSNWAGFRGNVDSLVIGVDSVRTTYDFESQAAPSPFPAIFPEGIPDALWDSLTAPSNILKHQKHLAGNAVRDLVYVIFTRASTPEERAVATASVGGTVVGGDAGVMYLVRIPYSLSHGDSVAGPLLRAIARLKRAPAVDVVTPVYLDRVAPTFRRPILGPGITRWSPTPDSSALGVEVRTTTVNLESQATQARIPAVFPGAIPVPLWDSLTAPANLIINSPQLGGRVIRNLLYVAFKESASIASRSGALARIGGRVVGGESLNLYAVRIPYASTAGDSSTGPLLRAIAVLEANPNVEMTMVAYLDGPVTKCRRPTCRPHISHRSGHSALQPCCS